MLGTVLGAMDVTSLGGCPGLCFNLEVRTSLLILGIAHLRDYRPAGLIVALAFLFFGAWSGFEPITASQALTCIALSVRRPSGVHANTFMGQFGHRQEKAGPGPTPPEDSGSDGPPADVRWSETGNSTRKNGHVLHFTNNWAGNRKKEQCRR